MHLFCPREEPASASGCVLGLKLFINRGVSLFKNGNQSMVSSCGFAYVLCLQYPWAYFIQYMPIRSHTNSMINAYL